MATWKQVPGFDGFYDVSDDGQVRSVKQGKSCHHRIVLKEDVHKIGGRITGARVTLCTNGIPKRYQLHEIVMTAFVGPRPDGFDICHNDGNPLNNRLGNLRYDTHINNEEDKRSHGTLLFGGRHPNHVYRYVFMSPEGSLFNVSAPTPFFQGLFSRSEAKKYTRRLTDFSKRKTRPNYVPRHNGWITIERFVEPPIDEDQNNPKAEDVS